MPIETLEAYIAEANIATNIDDDLLAEIGAEVVEDYDTDVRSRSEWEQRNKDYIKLATQVKEEKSTPWPNAANVKYPLLTTAAMQFSSRAYAALLPGYNIVKGRVVGKDDDGVKQQKALRIGQHMSYQLLEEMEEWEEDMDKLCMVLPIIGTAFKKTYYSPLKGRNISELVLADDLVVNYFSTSLEDAPRKTHRMEMSDNQIKERILNKIFLDVDLNTPTTELPSREVRKKVEGISSPDDESKPHLILEQHRFWDLDDDGYEEPYIVTVDYDTKQVLRIVARYDMTGVTLNDENEVVRIVPVEYFTKYSFIPNPDGGFYDLGFGSLLGPINDTVNTAINQLLDAGTLSTLQAGFLARGIRLKGGAQKFKPGEWKQVNSTGDDLRKGIFPLPVREPSPVLFQLLGLMITSGEKLSGTIDSMVGENPGQNQKATTTLAVLEQGMKVFNSIYKRLHRSLKKELKKLYRLNSIYLPEEVYFTILDPTVEAQESLARDDYDMGTADIIPAADPNVATEQQALAKAMSLLEILPLGTINPVVATQRVLEAQNQYGINQLMSMPPPEPPTEVKMEMAKMQDESALEWERLALEQDKVAAEVLKIRAEALFAMAKTEDLDGKAGFDRYKLELEMLSKEADRISQRAIKSQERKVSESSNNKGNGNSVEK